MSWHLRLIAKLSVVFILSVSTLLLGTLVLLASSTGTQMFVSMALDRTNSDELTLRVAGLSGSILDTVSASSLVIQRADEILEVSDVKLDFSLIELLRRRIKINSLDGLVSRENNRELPIREFKFSAGGLIEIDPLIAYLNGHDISPTLAAPIDLTLIWQLDVDDMLAQQLNIATTDSIEGSLNLKGEYRKLAVQHAMSSPVSIQSTGTIDVVDLQFQLEHLINDLNFQLGEDLVNFPTSTLNTSGNTTNISAIFVAEGIDISLDTDLRNQVTAYSVSIDSPEQFLPMLSPLQLRKLNASGKLSYSADNQLIIDIPMLLASVDEQPLRSSAHVLINDGNIIVQALDLSTSQNRIHIDGLSDQDGKELAFNFNAEINDWAELLPGASGSLNATGKLLGSLQDLNAQVNLSSSGLSYLDNRIASLSFELELSADEFLLEFELGKAIFAGLEQDPIDALGHVSGSLQNHDITLGIYTPRGKLNASLHGGIGDLVAPHWLGQLRESEIVFLPAGLNLSQESASVIDITTTRFSMTESCWQENALRGCVENTYSSEGLTSKMRVDDISVDLIGKLLGYEQLTRLQEDYQLKGMLDIYADYHRSLDGTSQSEISATMSDTQFQLTLGTDSATYSLADTSLIASSEEENWNFASNLVLNRESLLSNEKHEVASMQTSLKLRGDDAIAGKIEVQAQNVEWIETLTSAINQVQGQLSASIDVNGSLDNPQLEGTANFTKGTMVIPALGIQLNEIDVRAKSSANNAFEADARFTSGAGQISAALKATQLLEFSGTNIISPQVEFSLTGENFLLYDREDFHVVASPSLQLSSRDGIMHYEGYVDIPELDLTLAELPSNAIDISSDAVIVGADKEEDLTLIEKLSKNGITGEVTLQLGEDISLSGFGIQSGLSGNLTLRRSDGGSNLAYGELALENGSYELYGQALDIRQGRFLFFGALDNPGIDVRAVRQIDTQTVGVQMTGTLKNINSKLFSSPNLSDTDIVSMLAIGRPFANIGQSDQGAMLGTLASLGLERNQELSNQIRGKLGLDELSIDTSNSLDNSVLTVGKYLSPKLFARYGVGLFDNSSKVSLDYTLSDRIKLKAESGAQQSVEVVYSVKQ